MAELRWIEDNRFDPKFPLWTRANVGEVLPEPPSPLGWDLVFEGGTVLGWRDCMLRLGIESHEIDMNRPEVAGIFGGYAYLGATLLRVWAERTPGFSAELLDQAYFGGHPDVPPYEAEPWHENEHTTQIMAEWLGWVMGDRNQDELEAGRLESREIRQGRPDFATLSDEDLLVRAKSLKTVCRRLFDQHINQSAAAGIAPGILAAVCAAIGDPTKTMALMAGMGEVDSAAPSYSMWDLSRRIRGSAALTALFEGGHRGLEAHLRAAGDASDFVAAFDEFLAEFGSRGSNEWDIHSPTWETEPELALALIDRMRLSEDSSSPKVANGERQAERRRVGAAITETLAGDPETQAQFVAALASAETFLPGRERSKTNIIRVIGEVRLMVNELGRRAVSRGDLSDPGDVCMLFVDELEQMIDGRLAGVSETVADRRQHLAFLISREPPFLFSSPPPDNSEWPAKGVDRAAPAAAGEELSGIPGCPGTARGRAVVIDHPSEPQDLQPGDILVAPMTDPAWTPLFVPAAGVVVNVGAPLSHAIIVSRELGIPCVVSVTGATERIPNGATIEVNGGLGLVTVIDLP